MLLVVALVLLTCAPALKCQMQPPQAQHSAAQTNTFVAQQHNAPTAGARSAAKLLALDRANNRLVQLMPGLLDETLLSRGSFSFGAKLVKFDKLRVLGNVYVRRVNGRLLRDAYLLKSNAIDAQSVPKDKRSKPDVDEEEIRLQILA